MRNRGFSLIELLVVIGIIGVLVVAVVSAITSNSSSPSSAPKSTTTVEYPNATGHVVDKAEVLSYEAEQKITSTLEALDPKAQVAVITLKTTEPLSIEEYSIKLAEKWKPGYKGKDNGILFIVATEDRKTRIEVGRGLEGDINDAKAGKILDESVIPYFKDSKWEQGILSGVERIGKEVK